MSFPGPAIAAQGLVKAFGGQKVLDGLDLQIERGQMVALIGPSGAGKTTLLRILAGSLAPDAGRVSVLGREPATLAARARRELHQQLGFLYQNDALVPGLRVVHNVLIGRLGHWPLWKSLVSLAFPREIERARAALAAVDLADKLWAPIGTLSGGQRQRVAIARLLAQDAELIFADEPAAALDPRLRRTVVGLLVRLARERGRTCLVSLHDLELVDSGFDRVLALRDGRWFADGTPAVLTDATVRALFAGEPERPDSDA